MVKKKSPKRKPVEVKVLPKAEQHPSDNVKWWREALESLVIAVVLALLIRAFEAEAFVIPTGSMAPTLQGRHKDVECASCGYRYRAGASEDTEVQRGLVVTTVCPMCSYPMDLQSDQRNPNAASFTGDRILVNKFSYDLIGQPQRWDVIVFKYPGNAKQNYIKRLIGLPGEAVRIQKGDIYTKTAGLDEFRIARKPPGKLRALLQLVHDTKYIPAVLDQAGLPPRWQVEPGGRWTTSDAGRTFSLDTSSLNTRGSLDNRGAPDNASPADSVIPGSVDPPVDGVDWIRYRHIVPSFADWDALSRGQQPVGMADRRGTLITDFYAYNAPLHAGDSGERYLQESGGKNWVGDLALECDVKVSSDTGLLYLDLVEGGWHFQCRVDVATGQAALSVDGGRQQLRDDTGEPHSAVVAATRLKGPGKYRLLFSNVDNELRLWVNGRLCQFTGPTTYERDANFRPVWLPNDPGDMAPLGLGGQDIRFQVNRLRVHRDVYYVAVSDKFEADSKNPSLSEHSPSARIGAPTRRFFEQLESFPEELEHVLSTPEVWSSTPLFAQTRSVEFTLRDYPGADPRDEFFPMGDNSPQSRDARIWRTTWKAINPKTGQMERQANDNYVTREMLTGKAIFIYWPHPWQVGIPGTQWAFPLLPNLARMGIIR